VLPETRSSCCPWNSQSSSFNLNRFDGCCVRRVFTHQVTPAFESLRRCFGFSKAEADSLNLPLRSIWGALRCSIHLSEFVGDYEAESPDSPFAGLAFSNSTSDWGSWMSPAHTTAIRHATDFRCVHPFEGDSSLSRINYRFGASSSQARTPKRLQRISLPLTIIRSCCCNSPFHWSFEFKLNNFKFNRHLPS
jgi:hypothetical protein